MPRVSPSMRRSSPRFTSMDMMQASALWMGIRLGRERKLRRENRWAGLKVVVRREGRHEAR